MPESHQEHLDTTAALQAEAKRLRAALGLDSVQIVATLTDAVRTSGTSTSVSLTADVTGEDIVSAVAEIAQQNAKLGAAVVALSRKEAERRVDGLIGDGYLEPGDGPERREALVTLCLTNPDGFNLMVPMKPVLALTRRAVGVTPAASEEFDVDAFIVEATKPGGDLYGIFTGQEGA
jgi:hypothetical protein